MSPPVLALGMCATCLVLVAGVREMARVALLRSAVGQRLTVSVRSGPRGMRVENLTGATWSGCVVTLDGGLSSQPFTFPANGVMRLGYDAFRDGKGTLTSRDNPFGHAFRQTSVVCRDDAGQWRDATVK